MPNTRIGAGPVPARTCGTRADWHRLPGATLNGSFGCRPSNRPVWPPNAPPKPLRSEEHTSELQSPCNLVCRLLLEKKQDDLPDGLALVQQVEPQVDVLEFELSAHEAIDRQASLALQLDVSLNFFFLHASADVALLHLSLSGHSID